MVRDGGPATVGPEQPVRRAPQQGRASLAVRHRLCAPRENVARGFAGTNEAHPPQTCSTAHEMRVHSTLFAPALPSRARNLRSQHRERGHNAKFRCEVRRGPPGQATRRASRGTSWGPARSGPSCCSDGAARTPWMLRRRWDRDPDSQPQASAPADEPPDSRASRATSRTWSVDVSLDPCRTLCAPVLDYRAPWMHPVGSNFACQQVPALLGTPDGGSRIATKVRTPAVGWVRDLARSMSRQPDPPDRVDSGCPLGYAAFLRCPPTSP